MEVRLLGPVGLWHADQEIVLPRAQQRCVLAMLASNPGQIVAVQTMIDGVWGERPPDSAVHSLHAHVSRLRQVLARTGGGQVRRCGDGYVLDISQDQVDLYRSRRLVAQALRPPGAGRERDAQAASRLREACGLWRGTPLSGLAGDWAARVRSGLQQERLTVLGERYRAELELGKHAQVIGPLSALLADHPLAEPLAGLQMLALYRCGRQADALAVYAQTRRQLVEAIGDEPGAELRALHERILRRDPRLDWVPPTTEPAPRVSTADGQPRPPAAQLPADVSGFTGRADALRRLDQLLADRDSPAPALIVVLEGLAGVGKTALAVHWAHRVRQQFPAGQLYADLRGYAPAPPRRPAQVLAQFLRGLGVAPEQVPIDLDEAAALYRSLLADRPMLVVLDNAGSVDAVRPLLPGGDRCVVLVTSRRSLPGLVARDGAHHLRIDPLPPAESQALLSRLLGAGPVAAQPAALATLAERCDHLPLALRIAAANVTTNPRRSIAAYLSSLTGSDRLSALAVPGDPQAAIRAAFGLSYQRLSEPARRLFRLLGVVPGADIDLDAVAALAGDTVEHAGELLTELANAYLVAEPSRQRYTMHDLIRLFAAERVGQEETASARAVALRRLGHRYLQHVDAAAQLLYPELLRLPATGEATASPPGATAPPTDPATALRWLEVERANLIAVVTQLAEQPPEPIAWQLADALRGYFHLRSDPADWSLVAQAGLAAAKAAGDPLGQAAAQLSLATFHWHHNRYPQAIAEARQALTAVREAGWEEAEVALLNALGNSHAQSGHIDQAIDCYREALGLDRRLTHHAEANILNGLAAAYGQRGMLALVIEHASRARAINRRTGRRRNEAESLTALGDALHLTGRSQLARRYLAEAQAMFHAFGGGSGEANALRGLASVHRDLGQTDRARQLAGQALALLREGSSPVIETDCLAVLASVERVDDPSRALDTYRRARELAGQFRNPYLEAEALIGLATVHQLRDEYGAARKSAEQALTLAQEAGFRLLEGLALTALAGICLGQEDLHRAVDLAEQALLSHCETGHRLGEARAHSVLGEAWQRVGDEGAARQHRARAESLFAELGVATAAAAAP